MADARAVSAKTERGGPCEEMTLSEERNHRAGTASTEAPLLAAGPELSERVTQWGIKSGHSTRDHQRGAVLSSPRRWYGGLKD